MLIDTFAFRKYVAVDVLCVCVFVLFNTSSSHIPDKHVVFSRGVCAFIFIFTHLFYEMLGVSFKVKVKFCCL